MLITLVVSILFILGGPMKVKAEELWNGDDGYGIEIRVIARSTENAFYDHKEVVDVFIDDETPYKKGSLEYTASVLKRHLPHIYDQLKEHNYDLDLWYSVNYY
jgi:hypothetical protein